MSELLHWAPLAGITLLAAALRVYHIWTQSLWLDELADGTTAKVPIPDFFVHVRFDAGAAPLDYLGVKVATALLGHGTVATRAWALLMGIAAVPLIYVVARRVFLSHAIGLVAAFLLSLSAFHVYYSQEARFYALAVVVVLLNLLAFARALSSPRPIGWLFYGVSCALAFYSYYFVAFLLPLEGLFVLGLALSHARVRSRVREAIRMIAACVWAQALAVLVFVPWIVFALVRQLDAGRPSIPDLTVDRAWNILTVLIALNTPGSLASVVDTAMTAGVLVLALIGLVAGLMHRRFLALVLAIWVVGAIPLAWRVDQAAHYFWAERQAIIVLPVLILLAAAGSVYSLRLIVSGLGLLRSEPRTAQLSMAGLGVGLALAWALLAVPRIQRVHTGAWLAKDDWRGATTYVSSNLCPDTMVLSLVPAQYSYGIDYYDSKLEPRTRFAGSSAAVAAAVAHSATTPDDWIVVWGEADDRSLGPLLTSHGWRPERFARVTIYHGPVCAGGRAAIPQGP